MPIKTRNAAGEVILYKLHRAEGDRSVLVGPKHTDLNDDKLIITQRAPIAQKNYPGARKSTVTHVHGAISTEAGIPVRRPLRIDIQSSHTAGYDLGTVSDAVLIAINVFLQENQLADLIHVGSRPV